MPPQPGQPERGVDATPTDTVARRGGSRGFLENFFFFLRKVPSVLVLLQLS